MTVSAHDVASALQDRLPGLSTAKLGSLLYFCQGHHLAIFDQPLFGEAILLSDAGIGLGKPSNPAAPTEPLGEAELNTVGYIVSRYGALSERDLHTLASATSPWRLADLGRRAGGSARMEIAWIAEYFRAAEFADRRDDVIPVDSPAVAALLAGAADRLKEPSRPDSVEELQARLAHYAA